MTEAMQLDVWALELAEAVASRSRDPSTKVGCVILRPDKSVCSVGYNGFPRGMEDRPEWYEDRAEKYDRIVHAEANALLSAQEPVRGMTVYVTHPCCLQCAKMMAAAGVRRVVAPEPRGEFEKRWGSETRRANQIMSESGVQVDLL